MKLVATVSNLEEIALAREADIIEVRLDLFNFAAGEVRKLVSGREIIATFRRARDGGKYRGGDDERLEMLKEFADACNAEYVDIECDLPDAAFDFNCTVIESYHNFSETPEYAKLREMVENGRGDIIKIATLGRSKRDVLKVVKLLTEFDNVVFFLMGSDYSYTRIFSAFLGSPLIYCYVGEPKAPGQLHLEDASRILKMLG